MATLNGGLISTSSATTVPSNPNAEFGAEELLVLTVVQGLPMPVTVDDHVPGRFGTTSASKFSPSFGPQVSPIVQTSPSLHALLLLVDSQRPFAGLHASVVQMLASGVQTTGF